MAVGPAHLEVSIEIDSEPITGSVAVGAGRPQPFSGWMELVAVIEGARRDGDDGQPESSEPQSCVGAQKH